MAAACVATTCVLTAYMAASTVHLVSMEVIEGPISTRRKWTMVAVMWIKAVINVAVKALWTMKPGTGSDEDTAGKPLRAVVPVWSAAVRGVVEVPIRANGRHSDIDRDLGGCRACNA